MLPVEDILIQTFLKIFKDIFATCFYAAKSFSTSISIPIHACCSICFLNTSFSCIRFTKHRTIPSWSYEFTPVTFEILRRLNSSCKTTHIETAIKKHARFVMKGECVAGQSKALGLAISEKGGRRWAKKKLYKKNKLTYDMFIC